ncbi:MAG: hypothetical protein NTX05_08625 [Fusobacteria bacterium]|nr:hypothetical protein [Fusobacteriota bacterium]
MGGVEKNGIIFEIVLLTLFCLSAVTSGVNTDNPLTTGISGGAALTLLLFDDNSFLNDTCFHQNTKMERVQAIKMQ